MIAERFKIRAHAVGQIMTNGRSKSETLGKTAQSYLKNWLMEQPEIFNRRKKFSNKYTEKGLIMEDDALDLVASQLYDGKLLLKNEEHFSNGFMIGTPDCILKDEIIDVKSSWSWETFPLLEDELPSKDYFYQGQAYMELTGRDNFKVIYCLLDTPDHQIESECWSWCKRNGYGEPDDEIMEQFYQDMKYSDVDPAFRIKVFEFHKDQMVIDSINQRVEECREYLKQLETRLCLTEQKA